MASPVIIDSSSPHSLRLPTVTPPSRRGSTKATTSPSPALPSPSVFAKPALPPLKSGSRAQAIPANAGLGFASAGSLWRDGRLYDVGKDAVSKLQAVEKTLDGAARKSRQQETKQGNEPTVGKLKKPSKTAREQTLSPAQKTAPSALHLEDFACNDGAAPVNALMPSDAPSKLAARPPQAARPTRKSSVDLTDYTFGVYDLGMQTQAPAAVKTAAKKSRQKARGQAAANDSEPLPRAKPRRRQTKPDAVTLHPDDAGPEAKATHPEDHHLAAKQPAKKAAARPKKTAKVGSMADRDQASAQHSRAEEQSVYFTGASTAKNSPVSAKLDLQTESQDQASAHAPEIAAPRRRDWTPVKDSRIIGIDEPTHATASPPEPSSPKMQLADMLHEFSYIHDDAGKLRVDRAVSGEAMTKRRRIELADGASAGPAPRKKATTSKDPKEPKKPTGRKKLQTITSLATAAYHAPPEQPPEQSTVSEFFAPQKETVEPSKHVQHAVEKVKKPRKPRQKKVANEGTAEVIAVSKKPKKVKVKFDDTNYLTKLYSPSRATEQIKQQDFLFGTSSQLAVDEPAAFVRDMQVAVHASEAESNLGRPGTFDTQAAASQATGTQLLRSPRRSKSCAKVPTAPHGTCLSLRQAHSELWCISSRDHDGGFLQEAREGGSSIELGPIAPCKDTGVNHTTARRSRTEGQELVSARVAVPRQSGIIRESTSRHTSVWAVSPHDKSSPAANAGHDDSAHTVGEKCSLTAAAAGTSGREVPVPSDEAPPNDTWMLISSDGPEPEAASERRLDNVRSVPSPSRPPSKPSVDLQIARLGMQRTILKPVDANAPVRSFVDPKLPPANVARAFSASTSPLKPQSPTGRPRGRPRKEDDSAARTAGTSPRKRGRPPKRPVMASGPSPVAAKFKRPKAAVPASQPAPSPSGWLDIDEISDSESPVTPSPPRLRASSSPSAALPLNIAGDGSPAKKTAATASVATTLKPSEPQWPALRDQIFPKITNSVMQAPRGHDASQPSWYQKILMYDPITLEELTAWLNSQGLRIPVKRQKPKVKKRGRKKRDSNGNVIEEEAAVEWEVHEEQLQPWMVQKWCEDRSVCCVWAGGGWGGRTRH